MTKLSITDFEIVTTVGDNRQPNSGNVTFSDGKYWSWMLETVYDDDLKKYVKSDGILFFYSRKRCGVFENVMMRSAKREKLVQEYLKRDDLTIKVFKIREWNET